MEDVGDFVSALAEDLLPEGDPAREFVAWFGENRGRLPDACRELGVEPPEEGPRLFTRLMEAVLPFLKRRT